MIKYLAYITCTGRWICRVDTLGASGTGIAKTQELAIFEAYKEALS
jgi:hypothetical protein